MSEAMSEERLADLTVKAFNSSDSDYLHDVEELLDEIDRLRPLADEAAVLRAEKETLQRELIAAREEIDGLKAWPKASNAMRERRRWTIDAKRYPETAAWFKEMEEKHGRAYSVDYHKGIVGVAFADYFYARRKVEEPANAPR